MARISPSQEDLYAVSRLHTHVIGYFRQNWETTWIRHGAHFESIGKIHKKSNFFEDVKEHIDNKLIRKHGLVIAAKKSISTDTIRRFLLQSKMSFDDKVMDAFLVLTDTDLDWAEYRGNTLTSVPATLLSASLLTPLRIVAVMGIILLLSGSWFYFQKRGATSPDFEFSATVLPQENFPKTINISYDLKNMEYKTAMIFVDDQRISLGANHGKLTVNSFIPKKSRIKLFLDHKLVKQINVAVPSDGWWGSINNKVPLAKEAFMKNGIMQLSAYQKMDKIYGEFYTSFINIREFGMDADHLTLEAEVINNAEVGGTWAYDVSLDIFGTRGDMVFNLLSPDAGQYSKLTVAGTDFSDAGHSHALIGLGVNLADWSTLEVSTQNSTFRICLNGKVLVEESYEGKLGDLLGVQFYLKGAGAIKDVRLKPHGEKGLSI